MKTIRFLNMMAASLVGVAFMSCSSQDDVLTGGQNVLTPAGQTYTMSVTAQKGGDGTRALTLVDGTTLKATWTEGDVVKVYNSTSELIGTLTAQSAGATTTLTGDLTKLPTTGDELTLKYLSPSYSTQDGTLTGADNSIDKVCDYATATVTATVSGTNVTTGDATFQNQQAVVKFTLIDKATTNTAISPTALTINDGTDDIVKLTDIPDETYTANGAGVLFVAIPGFTEKPITLTATVGSDTYTCTTSEVKTLENGKYYGVTAKMEKLASVPDGALSGQFSVSDTKKVYFSKGNLQATYNTSWSWAFATNQWDYIGNAAGNTSINGGGTISGTGTVDLFGWVGAACAWTGAAQYGISNVKQAAQYGYVEGEALKSDWGTLAITNGGNTANFGWRTLTGGDDSGEWEYLFKTRTTPSGVRYAHATVNDVPGLVLLPDDWSTDYYSLNKVNDANSTAYTDNVISSSDWTSKLEAHGAVFLPAGGYRNGATVSKAGDSGYYWSSTSPTDSEGYALGFSFASTRFVGSTSGNVRNRGCSVRLVYDAN